MVKKKIKKVVKKESNKEVYWMIGVLVVMLITFLSFSAIFKSFHTFDYEGLTFTREKFGEIPVYHYYYYYNYLGDIFQYNLYLRNDPRENDIPVDGKIEFSSIRPVYISVNGHKLIQCEQSNIAVAGVSAFFTNNLVETRSATPNIIESQYRRITYADCENMPNDQVVVITSGEESKIETTGDSCYTITIANCEILDATEKFIVQTIIDASINRD